LAIPKAKEKRKTMRIEYVVNDFNERDLLDFLDRMIAAIDKEDNLVENANIMKNFENIDMEKVEIFRNFEHERQILLFKK
jgi:hypothetical protein